MQLLDLLFQRPLATRTDILSLHALAHSDAFLTDPVYLLTEVLLGALQLGLHLLNSLLLYLKLELHSLQPVLGFALISFYLLELVGQIVLLSLQKIFRAF